MKRVLVIVVTYNGMQWLSRCLASVASSGNPDDDSGEGGQHLESMLYVWDNDSTDGSADFVKAHFPQAKLVRSADNLGFSRPNNMGMEYALSHGFDYVYLLNQDAWLEPGALEKLVAAAEAHPEFGLLSPLQMTDGYQSLDKNFVKCYRKRRVKFVMAAHWLIPVRALKQVGLFEEELFPLYGQDDDWCRRLDYCGLKIGVVPEARAVHDRAFREEPLEKVVFRNYYTGSLLWLVNPKWPLALGFLYVILFTLVKAFKYRSFLPFKYFRQVCRDLPKVRKHRASIRTRARTTQDVL